VDRQEALDRLPREMPTLRDRFGVESLTLFGSTARDQVGAASDLDLLVTFEGRADFDRFMGLKLHLEDLFGRDVDLVTPNAFAELRAGVEREAIRVP
jgi:predicted nucleotidyltransferase